ncbi:Peptide chain release factor 3 [Candidatus Syntrophocurvum alkaliphilum]|uniref:Peptide chain release factor 3 n=1 Tax=Candidatus Syntrophocurvum alkaliphilum TaxID=2293317 RepID=A0A6I6DH84_9FIRM|nr:peptide chain release factor 3 [Candidatus Syntrophocurvum alkaliphilum]QGU00322.1 Peptide chain release factor 3 [Candidatus Syntrophocurvum alkaliphilum]
MTNIQSEVKRRRTFAIISHPDAGKTTLTEKLLLFGGAIRLAGTVKGRKSKKFATSDWMELEKQRGISVTSSAMQFSYNDYKVNILDTPGHQDFSEDTYRTLLAADSAVMLIDAAKGVEAQTIKLFEVCSLRGLPVFTFINKLDRVGKEPLELLEEIENVLGIRSYPMNWPVGMNFDFKGVYDRKREHLELFDKNDDNETRKTISIEEAIANNKITESDYNNLLEDLELLEVAGDDYNIDEILQGKLTPVFFGSALNNFGVQTFLEEYLDIAPPPRAYQTQKGVIDPVTNDFSGFVFKIQANMNPAHRDRIAFMRICSGKFEKGLAVNHMRSGKTIKLSQPQQFFAQERDIIEEAYPGDIIGVFDPGIFSIGDTVCYKGDFEFSKPPQFAPEIFARLINSDTGKYKQFQKGLHQLIEEGTIQLFKTIGASEELIIGAVGQLQFDVFKYRLKEEYGADIIFEGISYQMARWVRSNNPIDLKSLDMLGSKPAYDSDNNIIVLVEAEYVLRWLKDRNPDLEFFSTSSEETFSNIS